MISPALNNLTSNNSSSIPILYSFRRCPYAMRARMAIIQNKIRVELREILLKDKPSEMLALSPKGTVPILLLPEGQVIDESIDIMEWSFIQSNPDWKTEYIHSKELIDLNDNQFKFHLDRYKYSSRFNNDEKFNHRNSCVKILKEFQLHLENKWIGGEEPNFVDMSILPFIRQFRIADTKWFDNNENIINIKFWLFNFLDWEIFNSSMQKYELWRSGERGIEFGNN